MISFFRILCALLFVGLSINSLCAADGTLSLRYIGGAWTLTKPDGTTIPVNQATYGVPEALAEAASSGAPLFHYCRGPQHPLTFTNYTLDVPAQVGGNYRPFGCVFSFNNLNTTTPGLRIDTYAYGAFDLAGNQVWYAGNGRGVLVRPVTSVPSAAAPTPVTTWLRGSRLDFGTVIATGGNPAALVSLDATGVYTTDPYLASSIAANMAQGIRFTGECYGRALHALELVSPQNGRQLVSQNLIHFYAESCLQEEIYIGTPTGQFDVGLSTNIYIGNPTHGMLPPSAYNPPLPFADPTAMVFSNASWSQFWFNSANNESGIPLPSIFKFGPQANANVVCTKQAFGAAALASDATGTNAFTCGVPSPVAPHGIIGTTGEPFTVNLFAGTWTMCDMSWKVPNGVTVTKLGLYATTPMTVPLILARRDSAGIWTEIVTQSISHTGNNWQDVAITPTVIPATGDYYQCVYTTGLNQTFIDYKARAYQVAQLAGTMSGITEEAPHVQWYVIPVRATYQ